MFFESNRDSQHYYHEGDNNCLPHFHRSVEFLYVTKGEKQVLINGEKKTLSANQLLVCPPYTLHSYLRSNGAQIVATVSADYCVEFERFCRAQAPQTFIVDDTDGEMIRLIRQIKTACNRTYLRGTVNCLLGLYQSKTEFSPCADLGEKMLIVQIAEYIHENYAENITLETLSKQFGYSRNYFSALFKKFFQTGVTQYINSVRVQRSVKLLRSQKISSVYTAVGFQSPQQYFLNFKRFYGCTPKEYLRETQRVSLK